MGGQGLPGPLPPCAAELLTECRIYKRDETCSTGLGNIHQQRLLFACKMSANACDQPKKRNRSGENFKKRWNTFVKNGFQVHRDYHADVYILLRRKGQTYEFRSSDKAWPLSTEDLVRSLILRVAHGAYSPVLISQYRTRAFPYPSDSRPTVWRVSWKVDRAVLAVPSRVRFAVAEDKPL